MRFILMLCFMVLAPILAFAQTVAPPETVDQATAYLPQLLAAISAGDYKIIGGVVLMFIMVVVRQFVLPKVKITSDVMPFVVAALAALSFAGMSMLAPGVTVLMALKNGFITAFVAGGAWDLIGKYLMKLVLGDSFQPVAPTVSK